jgi:hypothetical protein
MLVQVLLLHLLTLSSCARCCSREEDGDELGFNSGLLANVGLEASMLEVAIEVFWFLDMCFVGRGCGDVAK